jgi:hypothetical protein
LEVKRVQNLSIHKAVKQSVKDAVCIGDTKITSKIPVVMHRKNGEEWLTTMRLTDWVSMYRALYYAVLKDNSLLPEEPCSTPQTTL